MFNLYFALILTILILYRIYRGDVVSNMSMSIMIGLIVLNFVIFAKNWRQKQKKA
ncbi:hypothetical protein [Brevibacillus reuszeri]|uniref:hypothetical protein n=1 Tax=Brevibacillus reuszeri TaxID=54915 RepID=UPI0028A20A56|nr:hypothetical protein [Brevibacillus reuszeri]